jgi:hypothetical protein
VAALGNAAFVVQGDGVVHTFDVSTPAAPVATGWLDKARDDTVRPNQVIAVDVMPNTLIVVHSTWLQAIDVTDPARPLERAWLTAADLGVTSGFTDVAVSGERLFLTTQGDGLVIVSLNRRDQMSIFLPWSGSTSRDAVSSRGEPARSITFERVSVAR